jgi:hypothetical protein
MPVIQNSFAFGVTVYGCKILQILRHDFLTTRCTSYLQQTTHKSQVFVCFNSTRFEWHVLINVIEASEPHDPCLLLLLYFPLVFFLISQLQLFFVAISSYESSSLLLYIYYHLILSIYGCDTQFKVTTKKRATQINLMET